MPKKPTPTRCRSCGAEMYFAKTEGGQTLPVDVEPREGGNVLLDFNQATGQLTATVIGKDNMPPAGRNRYMSHFATCPHAKSWRQPDRGQRPFDAPPLAITLHSPWAQCIIHGTKRVENRTWKPPTHIRGERLAIHCGKSDDAEKWAELQGAAADPEHPLDWAPSRDLHHPGCVIGSAVVVGVRLDDRVHMFDGRPTPDGLDGDPWYIPGNYGWLLDEIHVYEPVEARGYQKVWKLKDKLRHQLKLAEAPK